MSARSSCKASWRETQVGHYMYVSLGLLGSFWFDMSKPLLVVGPASATFCPRPATVGLVGRVRASSRKIHGHAYTRPHQKFRLQRYSAEASLTVMRAAQLPSSPSSRR